MSETVHARFGSVGVKIVDRLADLDPSIKARVSVRKFDGGVVLTMTEPEAERLFELLPTREDD